MTPFITRTKHGKSFEYNLHGKPVASEQKHRIRGLIIPPAWHDVQIAVSSRAKVQATGSDNEGRKQYIYHPSYKSKQEHAKFSKTLIFGKRLPRLRRHIVKNMKRSKLDKKR